MKVNMETLCKKKQRLLNGTKTKQKGNMNDQ